MNARVTRIKVLAAWGLLYGQILLPRLVADEPSSGGGWSSIGTQTNFGVVGTAILSGDAAVGTSTNSSGPIFALFRNAGLASTVDSDQDGMPDVYENDQGLDSSVDDSASDADGDGSKNLAEYITGTNPHDRTSFLHVTVIEPQGSATRLTWTSVAGKTYVIQRSSNLRADSWTPVTSITADSATTSFDVPLSDPAPQLEFYRIVVSSH